MYPEQNLIEGLKLGKEEAYKLLFDREYKILCVLANQYTKDNFVSETIVSDIIFSIWKNREQLEIHSSLRAYLVKSVKNRCLNFLDSQKREINLDSQINQLERIQLDQENSRDYPINLLIEKELDLKIKEILSLLPPLTSEIFFESRRNCLKYTDISLKKGVSVDVVKYHIKIALSILRKGLKDYLPLLIPLLT